MATLSSFSLGTDFFCLSMNIKSYSSVAQSQEHIICALSDFTSSCGILGNRKFHAHPGFGSFYKESIFSGHLSPENKEVFLIKIMLPALKTLANMIFRRNRKPVELLEQFGDVCPMDE